MENRRSTFVESIFYPTDFGAGSERAFVHALAMALVEQTSFTLFHTDNQPDVEWHRFPGVRETLERWGLLESGSDRSAVFDQLSVLVNKIKASGEPANACLDAISEMKPDLVVMATEGRDGLARWLRPSVAARVGRRSNTVVLFVPNEGRGFVEKSNGHLSLRRILIPVDEVPDPAGAIGWATRIAESLGDAPVEIQILRVNGEPRLPSTLKTEAWRISPVSSSGDVIEEIIAAAEGVDLIVMPTDGRDGVLDVFRGSHTERVLRGAPCPILAVPAV
jgi:nucleotide-binding universal stress UspA family protein